MKDDKISSLSETINQENNELSSSEMKDNDISSSRERRIKRRIAFSLRKLKERRTVAFY